MGAAGRGLLRSIIAHGAFIVDHASAREGALESCTAVSIPKPFAGMLPVRFNLSTSAFPAEIAARYVGNPPALEISTPLASWIL
jgi:hypothetical protein